MRKPSLELQARRREEIVSAAISCFSRYGFHQSSMQNIAQAAGVSMGLLYRYFENKEAIINVVANLERDKTRSAIEAIRTDGFTERNRPARTWANFVLKVVRESLEPDLLLLVNEVIAEAGRTPTLHATLKAHDAALTRALILQLERQKQNGCWPRHSTPALGAQIILMLIDGLIARRWTAPKESLRLRIQHIETIIDAIGAQ
jgi:AcrR family transcriptional regulator